ncbi:MULTISPECIES: hypothetical protein [Rhodopseudomonas]|uniref:GIY-YIG nuclease family protein n=1 Tax=Rhodopseudomonas palustris TaxID=1076 RepID=A0A0D7F4S3_RHOPL|nr:MULTISPECIES: hypothetical protein [Rhodopseudomonas]KIZ47771.1 hypothetical protein OO17_02505 [Rhodopseudomonas palustris]MDF3810772.1 hypothetical protein [Rhodopseudomonas sp. BAL398]WOK20573.1 hypothetical protein RBJ75_14100 [Rhodopseudomonas sp. BAL398]
MGINIGNYTFDGIYSSPAHLADRSGVYAVLGATMTGQKVVDIGESGWIRTRIQAHDRAPAWARQGLPLSYAALYCDETSRMRIERELRARFNPPCGDR